LGLGKKTEEERNAKKQKTTTHDLSLVCDFYVKIKSQLRATLELNQL